MGEGGRGEEGGRYCHCSRLVDWRSGYGTLSHIVQIVLLIQIRYAYCISAFFLAQYFPTVIFITCRIKNSSGTTTSHCLLFDSSFSCFMILQSFVAGVVGVVFVVCLLFLHFFFKFQDSFIVRKYNRSFGRDLPAATVFF